MMLNIKMLIQIISSRFTSYLKSIKYSEICVNIIKIQLFIRNIKNGKMHLLTRFLFLSSRVIYYKHKNGKMHLLARFLFIFLEIIK